MNRKNFLSTFIKSIAALFALPTIVRTESVTELMTKTGGVLSEGLYLPINYGGEYTPLDDKQYLELVLESKKRDLKLLKLEKPSRTKEAMIFQRKYELQLVKAKLAAL